MQLQVVEASERTLEIPPPGSVAGSAGASLASVVLTLALTDLAFSLDSVAAAVAVTDRLPLVMAGGVIGVIALRLTAGLFIRWLEEFRHLESAGYLAVGLVGIRLLLRLAGVHRTGVDPAAERGPAVCVGVLGAGADQRPARS